MRPIRAILFVVGSVVDAATVRVELQGNNAVLSLAEVQVFGYTQ